MARTNPFEFIQQVRTEVSKVTWPTRRETVITTVMELVLSDPAARRVVVEPDVRNTAVHALNAAMGFRVLTTVTLKDKEAHLSTCTRAQFRAAVAAAPTTGGIGR